MNKTIDLINWFWAEHKHSIVSSCKNGFCQCESEEFIEKSLDPNLMRAFLIIGVFIDQLIHSHHRNLHNQFGDSFRYPKNSMCQTGGMSNANWFINSYHGYDKKVCWDSVERVAEIIVPDTIQWLKQHEEHFDRVEWTFHHLYPEINHVFKSNSGDLILNIISKIIQPDVNH